MLFASISNVAALDYRVAVRPLTVDERNWIRHGARVRYETLKTNRFVKPNPKELEHLRRIVEEESYLDHVEVLQDVGQEWPLPE